MTVSVRLLRQHHALLQTPRRFFIADFLFIADFFSRPKIRADDQITVFHLVFFTENQVSEKLFKIAFILINTLLDIGIIRSYKRVSEIPRIVGKKSIRDIKSK